MGKSMISAYVEPLPFSQLASPSGYFIGWYATYQVPLGWWIVRGTIEPAPWWWEPNVDTHGFWPD